MPALKQRRDCREMPVEAHADFVWWYRVKENGPHIIESTGRSPDCSELYEGMKVT
jgi:hypothetical protein